MILLGNKRGLLNPIVQGLEAKGIPFDANQREDFKDSNHGRFLSSLLRIMEDSNDYVAHRVLLGTPRGVGLGTMISITDKVIANNLNYRSIFYNQLPNQVFTTREIFAINKAIANINVGNAWNLTETLNQRVSDIDNLIRTNFGQAEVTNWRNQIANLPLDMTLAEFKEYLETDSEVVKSSILDAIRQRIRPQNAATNGNPLDKIRIMSFHSSKGLDSKIVFIPGLEEGTFPTQRAQQAAGLLLENARLFLCSSHKSKSSMRFKLFS